jgi:hypothetical protein
MQFLYPQFLYAFATLLIPILIHLFYFRRFKTVYFSNVRFLSQLQEQKQTRSRLKHWLTLITRLLLLSALILAFAQPYFPSASSQPQTGKNAISIYLDNSFSMRSVGEEGNLIQAGKQKVREISDQYRDADAFQLLTNEFSVPNQEFVQRSDLIPKVEKVTASPALRKLQMVVNRQTSLLKDQEAANKVAFLIGDFQKSSADLDRLKLDSSITYYFIPLKPGEQSNLFIDSAWLNTPTLQANQNHRIKFRLRNTGSEPVKDLTTKLRINGKQKGLATTTVPANSQDTGSVVFMVNETGWNTGQLSIKDYPITFDDTYYLSYPVAKERKILNIHQGEPNRYLRAAYNTDDYFTLTHKKQGNLRYDNFSEYDLVILDQIANPSSGLINELEGFVKAGGNLFILPPALTDDQASNPYKQLMARFQANRLEDIQQKPQDISKIQLSHPLFQNIFSEVPDNVQYPEVKKYYRQTQYTSAGGRVLMRLSGGDPLLSLYPYSSGHVFTSTVPMNGEWSNMPENALFIPLMYKIALYQDQPFQLGYKIGQVRNLRLNRKRKSKDQVFKLTHEDYSTIPAQQMRGGQLQLFLDRPLPEAGIYRLEPNQTNQEANDKADPYPQLAFNYNRQESLLEAHTPNAIQQALKSYENVNVVKNDYASFGKSLERMQKGTFLWKYFIWAALGLLLVETLLLKLLK